MTVLRLNRKCNPGSLHTWAPHFNEVETALWNKMFYFIEMFFCWKCDFNLTQFQKETYPRAAVVCVQVMLAGSYPIRTCEEPLLLRGLEEKFSVYKDKHSSIRINSSQGLENCFPQPNIFPCNSGCNDHSSFPPGVCLLCLECELPRTEVVPCSGSVCP